MKFYYVYVLRSIKDKLFYTGYTDNLQKRFNRHNKGLIYSTKHRKPFILIYSEACLHQQDATAREKFLKTGMGKRYLKNRLKRFLFLTA